MGSESGGREGGGGGGAICEGVSRRAKGMKVWYCKCRNFHEFAKFTISRGFILAFLTKLPLKEKLYIFSRIFKKCE